MAGAWIVAIGCDDEGNVDMADLKAKAAKHADKVWHPTHPPTPDLTLAATPTSHPTCYHLAPRSSRR